MEAYLTDRYKNPVLQSICRNLTLKEILQLRSVNRVLDCEFQITDETGEIRQFNSLTPKNIAEYKRIQEKLLPALFHAAYQRDTPLIIKLLRERALDVNAVDKDGYQVFHILLPYSNLEILREILKRRDLNLNFKIKTGQTILILASANDEVKVVQELLKRMDLDVNARGNNGYTALMWAASNNRPRVVEWLLTREDLDVNAKNNYGETALDIAQNRGNRDVIAILSQDARTI